jgi:hypothetical protein
MSQDFYNIRRARLRQCNSYFLLQLDRYRN